MPETDLGALVVDLLLRDKQFDRGLTEAQAKIRAFVKVAADTSTAEKGWLIPRKSLLDVGKAADVAKPKVASLGDALSSIARGTGYGDIAEKTAHLSKGFMGLSASGGAAIGALAGVALGIAAIAGELYILVKLGKFAFDAALDVAKLDEKLRGLSAIDGFGGATDEQLANSKRLTDSLNALSLAWDNVRLQVGKATSGPLAEVVVVFVEAAVAATSLAAAWEKGRHEAGSWMQAIDDLKWKLNSSLFPLEEAIDAWNLLAYAVSGYRKEANLLIAKGTLDAIKAKVQGAIDLSDEMIKQMEAEAEAARELGRKGEEAAKKEEAAAKAAAAIRARSAKDAHQYSLDRLADLAEERRALEEYDAYQAQLAKDEDERMAEDARQREMSMLTGASVLRGILEQLADTSKETGVVVEEPFDAAATGIEMAVQRAKNALKDLDDSFDENGDGITSWGERITGVVNLARVGLQAFAGAVSAVTKTAGNILSSITGWVQKLTGFSFNLFDLAEEVADQVAETGGDPEAIARKMMAARVAEAVAQFKILVSAAPALIQGLIRGIPDLIGALADGIPDLLDTVIKGFPRVFDAVIAQGPRIFEAIGGAIGGLVDMIIAKIPDIMDSIGESFDLVGELVSKIVDAIPGIFSAIIKEAPALVEKFISMFFEIVTALVRAIIKMIPDIVISIIDSIIYGLPDIIVGIVELIPEIIIAILEMLPMLFDKISKKLQEVPAVIFDLVFRIIGALVKSAPRLIAALFSALFQSIGVIWILVRDIAAGLWKAITDFSFEAFGQLVVTLANAVWAWIKKAGKDIAEYVANAFFAAFGIRRRDRANASNLEIPTAGSSARLSVNAPSAAFPEGRGGVLDRARASSGGGGDRGRSGGDQRSGRGTDVTVAVVAEGRLLEAVQISATDNGRATKQQRRVRRAAGVRVGLDRGLFNPLAG